MRSVGQRSPVFVQKFQTIKRKGRNSIFVFCWCAFVETNDEDFRSYVVNVTPRTSICPVRFVNFLLHTIRFPHLRIYDLPR